MSGKLDAFFNHNIRLSLACTEEPLPYEPESTLNCTPLNTYVELQEGHGEEEYVRRAGKLSVLLEQTETLTTENTRLTDVSRATTRHSILSSVSGKSAAFIRRIKQFFRRRDVVGGVHLKLPAGIPDLTKGLHKSDFRTSVASGAFAAVYKCRWDHDKKSDLVSKFVVTVQVCIYSYSTGSCQSSFPYPGSCAEGEISQGETYHNL